MNSESLVGVFMRRRAALVDYAARIVGSREAAEDLVQEAWLRVDGLAVSQTMEHPRGYIYRIVRNLAFDAVRRTNFERRLFIQNDDVARTVSDALASPEASLSHRQELAIVMEALEELPERTREAFSLYRIQGLKLKDVAERLEISVALAHALVFDGLAHCRDRLRKAQRMR